jgi:PAS domain S-box-containing protein
VPVNKKKSGKKRELVAKHSLEELIRFPNMHPGPVLQVDLQGNIIMSNTTAREIFGSRLRECCWQDICPDLDKNTWSRILKTKTSVSIERMLGDTPFIFSHRFDTESGKVYVFGTDITEQKKVEKALRESEERVRLLLNSTVEGIYGIDLSGVCTFANASCVRLLDFDDADELIGKKMHPLIHRTRSDGKICTIKESRIFKAMLKGEGVHVIDEVMFRRDNSSFPVEYWSHPVKQDEKLIGCVVTFMDITNRKQVEKLQSDYTSALTEIARFPEMNPGPVLRIDLNGKILMANKAAHDLFKKPVGQSWKDIFPGIDNKVWDKIIHTDSVALERRMGNKEYVFTHRLDFDGHLIFIFGADITEQKQAERALQQTEKMASLGKLSAGLAHELNNPAAAAGRAGNQLNEVLSALQIATVELSTYQIGKDEWHFISDRLDEFRRRLKKAPPFSALDISDREEELQQWLEIKGIQNAWQMASTMVKFCIKQKDLDRISGSFPPEAGMKAIQWLYHGLTAYELSGHINSSTRRITNLVRVIKSYSYMDTAPEKQVDIHTGIEDTVTMLTGQLKKTIEVIRLYDRSLPAIQVQGSELNQVWTSILDNAIYAMKGRGKIVIKTFRQKNWLVTQIWDTGPGIPEVLQSKIFDPFFTTKAPGEGAGLGLHMSHQIIVQKHKGKLSVSSVPGETCFEVRLPLAR